MRRQITLSLLLGCLLATTACGRRETTTKSTETKPAATTSIAVTTVVSEQIDRRLRLPGELQPWQEASLHPRVSGFVERMLVDRGTVVRAGQLLVSLTAPELRSQRVGEEAMAASANARRLEAEARVSSARALRVEAEASLTAATSTLRRLRSAAATPGVVSGNELEIATRRVEAEEARVLALTESEKAAAAQARAVAENESAAKASASSARTTEDYLRIIAPFAGTITERLAHPGSLASPAQPLLRLQQVSRLRLVVAVPESEVASIRTGTSINFSVPAFPGENFSAKVARTAAAVDPKTRTMPVELDVANPTQKLSPGMFPQVTWPSARSTPSLLVPPSAVAVTTERTFVIRVRNGVAEWVDVKRGVPFNLKGTDLVEVFGDLAPGDQIALRGTDELRQGSPVTAK